MNRIFNKKGLIENTVEVNIYYQKHRKRIEINVIGGQKQSIILGILQLAHHNPKIDWKTEKVKITRCLEEYGKQWRPKQKKPEWKKQEEEGKKQKKKKKRNKVIEVNKVAKEQEIWDEKKKTAKLVEGAKKLVPEHFHK